MIFAEKWTYRQEESRGEIYYYSEGGWGVHISFWFKPLLCDSKPNEQKPRKPWLCRMNFSSVWLLSKYNSKAANMRMNYIHKRKNNLLWGFISWRGFLSKRKKEKKVAFNKFPQSRYISYITLSTSVNETFSSVLQTTWTMLSTIFLFILIFYFFLFAVCLGWLPHSFFNFPSGCLEFLSLLHLLDSYQHESSELAACPFL